MPGIASKRCVAEIKANAYRAGGPTIAQRIATVIAQEFPR
jgi:alanine racemase